MLRCPKHVEEFVLVANERFPTLHDEYNQCFAVRCPCGGKRFGLKESNRRSVIATCGEYHQDFVLYDLRFYPSASKLKGVETFGRELVSMTCPVEAFIVYEYGQADEDCEFDRDDITWCTIYIEHAGFVRPIFDDETA